MPQLLPTRAPAAALSPIVRALAGAGVTPAALTWAGFLGNVAAAVLIWQGQLFAGGAVMLLSSALDLLDGALARSTGRASAQGALLDSTLDRASEAAVLLGVLAHALDESSNELAVLTFVSLAASLLVSYVRARTEGLGGTLTDGLFRRQERVVLLGLGLLTGWLRLALWLLAVLSSLTVAQRLWLGMRALARRDRAA